MKDTVLPLLWFDEGLDELGQDLIDVIGQAVLDPPVYKNYLLCVFLGKTYSSILLYHFCMHAQHFCSTWMPSQMQFEKIEG